MYQLETMNTIELEEQIVTVTTVNQSEHTLFMEYINFYN